MIFTTKHRSLSPLHSHCRDCSEDNQIPTSDTINTYLTSEGDRSDMATNNRSTSPDDSAFRGRGRGRGRGLGAGYEDDHGAYGRGRGLDFDIAHARRFDFDRDGKYLGRSEED